MGIQAEKRPLNGHHKTLSFKNPATGELLGEVNMTTATEVQAKRREMGAAAKTWAAKSVKARIAILRKLQGKMIEQIDEITAVMNQDNGKSRQDALAEVFITVNLLDEYCKHAPRWLRRRRVPSGLQIFKRCFTEQHPHGVVGIISPWNYPFVLTIPPLVSALIAGNTVLVKPSEVTPGVGQMMQQLIESIPELAPFVRFLHGDGRIGAALVESKPDLIFLTGSTRTGQIVMKACAETLTPVICELGGKDPMIVLKDADIEAAAKWGVWGAFYNTGQTCMGVERIYVVKEKYDAFVRAVAEETQRLKVGFSPELDSQFDLGPLTLDRQADIVQAHLDDAKSKGARILLGGKQNGLFFEPTVLIDVDHSMQVMKEETFGPLLPIMQVEDETHAIQLANDSELGLSGSVWGQDIRHAEKVARQLEVGSVNINDTISHFAIPRLPFGGIKTSGIGRTHGEKDLLQFTQTRSYVTGNPPLPFDIATILRAPGNYKLGSAIIHLVFGTSLEQRLKPVVELMEEKQIEPAAAVRKTAVVAGTAVAAVAVVFGLLRARK